MKQTDYLVLVNQLNALPNDWYETLETVRIRNRYDEELVLEKRTAAAYRKLKAELEENGIVAEPDSALRSIEVQQEIMDEFIREYGESYAKKTVAPPGYSEHHTGLAVDLFLIIDGNDSRRNEDLVQHPELWSAIHKRLSKYGFILRYPYGKEHITGYGYEPWHIRYLNDPAKAEEIMRRNISLEEYLGAAAESFVSIDYGTSRKYSEEELYEATVPIRCRFAADVSCTLEKLTYSGDRFDTEDALKKLNAHNTRERYTGIAVFTAAVHRNDAPDKELFIPWVMGRTERDGWDIVGCTEAEFRRIFS